MLVIHPGEPINCDACEPECSAWAAFDTISREVFSEVALAAKMTRIVAVAMAHATQRPCDPAPRVRK